MALDLKTQTTLSYSIQEWFTEMDFEKITECVARLQNILGCVIED